jgi:hypothetical protein
VPGQIVNCRPPAERLYFPHGHPVSHKLTYFYGGLEQKLTGVIEPEAIKGLLA